MDYIKDKRAHFLRTLSAPIIFSVLIPVVILDLWFEFYHRTCFPLYGLSCVKRSNYVKIDRQKLEYLTWEQKIGCMYCGYVNGIIGYWVEIAARSEQYWCGIAHKKTRGFIEPKHHKNFVKYGDKKAFVDRYEN